MDKRLIPPSHFDPNEDSSAKSPWDDNNPVKAALPQIGTSPFLRPPQDFLGAASSGKAAGVLNIGVRRNDCLSGRIFNGRGRDELQLGKSKDHQPTPNSHNSRERYSELLELKAENEALHSLLERKKRNLEEEVTQRVLLQGPSHAHQAVIEHQTQHIIRLQKDLDEQRSLFAKRENEILQHECAFATKARENEDMKRKVEKITDELQHKDNLMELKLQEMAGFKYTIEDLKKQYENTVKSHAANVEDLQDRFEEEKEALRQLHSKQNNELVQRHEEEKLSIKQEMSEIEEEHRHEVERILQSHEEEKSMWAEKIGKSEESAHKLAGSLEDELSAMKTKCCSVEKMLEQQTAMKEGLQTELLATADKLVHAQENSDKHLARITQLQAYIGELQTEDYERSQWKEERTEFEENILALQNEKQSMNKTMELQNIRLQSITKILMTQEETINASTRAFSTNSSMGGLAHIVIRKWREKVLEMMVQIKSNEINLKKLQDTHQAEKSDLNEQLEDEKRVSIILENQLAESRAVLEMRQTEVDELVSKNSTLLQQVEMMRIQISEAENGAAAMADHVREYVTDLNHIYPDTMTKMSEKLIHMEQRLLFATNRMKTLQGLYVRRENILKARLKFKNETTLSVDETPDDIPGKESSKSGRPDLVAEIDRLTEERDSLSQQLSKDSALFDSATTHFKSRETKLLEDISLLQHEVQSKSEEVAELKKMVEALEDRIQDKTKEVSDANEILRDVTQNQDRTLQEKLQEAWDKWHEEKKSLLQKLEESQREHARTVVNSRQNERTAIRDRKRAEENLEAITSEHKKEMTNLKSKMKSLKVDNNLLMTTLRQQGIVSSYKAARKEARELQNSSPSKTRHSRSGLELSPCKKLPAPLKSASSSEVQKTKSSDKQSAPAVLDTSMEELLKDLVVMTESILSDSG